MSTASDVPKEENEAIASTTEYGWRFWAVFAGLTLSALLSALEGSVLSTAMPVIAGALGAKDNYIWIVNIYFLTGFVMSLSSCPLFPR